MNMCMYVYACIGYLRNMRACLRVCVGEREESESMEGRTCEEGEGGENLSREKEVRAREKV